METHFADISVKGKIVRVPAIVIRENLVVVNGGWIKIAEIHDEPWQPHGLEDPVSMLAEVKQRCLPGDVFTFSQRVPDVQPRYSFPFVLDNVAAVKSASYSDWWEKLPQETRKNVRRASKRGVVVNSVPFDDGLIQGIKGLYDESPFRQGRRFWHYGKDLAAIKRENSSYLDRCEFIGAYFEGELIGLLKMVYLANAGRIMQILSKNSHYDKRPMNALIAKAVEVCANRGLTYFIYGQYVYGNNGEAAIIEFKRRNGFEQVSFPKYYVPLTAKGSMAMRLNLHLGFRRLLPRRVENALRSFRSRLNKQTHVRKQPAPQVETVGV